MMKNKQCHSIYLAPKGNSEQWSFFRDNAADVQFVSCAEFERIYHNRVGASIQYDEEVHLFKGGAVKYSSIGACYVRISHPTEKGLAKMLQEVKSAGRVGGPRKLKSPFEPKHHVYRSSWSNSPEPGARSP